MNYYAGKELGNPLLDYYADHWLDQITSDPTSSGIYLDASGVSTSAFNMGDALGRSAEIWDFNTNDVMTLDEVRNQYRNQFRKASERFETVGIYPLFNQNGGFFESDENNAYVLPGGKYFI